MTRISIRLVSMELEVDDESSFEPETIDTTAEVSRVTFRQLPSLRKCGELIQLAEKKAGRNAR